ncbi:MAG: 50S ribosomal protein L17 [Agriterribacter sp.]
MRHGDKINNLSRTASHRKALLSNLANALLLNKRIVTTLAKAKALRVFIEPLITKTKKNENKEQISHNHRLVFSALNNKEAVKELFTVIAPKVAGRPGGYTRIIKLGKRIGDNAETALIELVNFNEVYGKGTEKAATGTTKRTRRAGGGKKKADAKEETAAEVKPEATATEAAEEAKPE